MSLDLIIVMKERIARVLKNEVHALLVKEGFEKGKYVYNSTSDQINIDVSYSTAADIRWYWRDMDNLLGILGYMPGSEINLSSRHTQLSHVTSYKLAKKIASLVDGIIYDPQVAELYDHHGKSLKKEKKGGRVFKYGSGTGLFMRSVGLVEKIMRGKGDIR
jgi:hypothetical protein